MLETLGQILFNKSTISKTMRLVEGLSIVDLCVSLTRYSIPLPSQVVPVSSGYIAAAVAASY